MQTDAELVELARADSAEAFAALYDRYADRIHAFCYSRLRDDADAADALQETFINAHWRLAQLQDPSKFRPWVFAIARNTVTDLARARGRHERRRDWGPVGGRHQPTDPNELDMAAEQAGPDRGLLAEESAALLWDAAGALQPRDQELLELHLRAGLEGAELAEAMAVEPAHVYVMVKRMKDRLSSAVGSLLVARVGRGECTDLDELLADWDGTFSLAVRSQITRHVERCDTCHATRRAAVAWESIAAAMPAPPAPAAVRLAVLTVVTGGVVGLTSATTSASAANAAPDTGARTDSQDSPRSEPDGGEPPPAEPEDVSPSDGPESGLGRSGPPSRAGLPSVVATTGLYLFIAIVTTGIVVAWPVVWRTDTSDVVITEVAGVQETRPPSEGDGSGNDALDPSGAPDDGPAALVEVGTTGSTTTTTTSSPSSTSTSSPTSTSNPTPIPPTTRSTARATTSTTTQPPTTQPPTSSTTTSTPATSTTSTSTTSTSTTSSTTSTPTTSTTSTSTSTTSTSTSSTTTSTTTTSTTTTTTTTTAPPIGAVFQGSADPITFPTGATTVDYTFANVGDTPMSWAASTLSPFAVRGLNTNSPKGTLLPGSDVTLTLTFDASVPPGDYTGILDLNTDGGDVDIELRVTSPPAVTADFQPSEVWEDSGACAGGQAGLSVQTTARATATDDGSVVSVTATWGGAQVTPLAFDPVAGVWTGAIGPYGAPAGGTVDVVLVEATDDTGNVAGTLVALTINPCPL